MGWQGASIGNYSMYIHDSIWDSVRKPRSKESLEKQMVDVYFKNRKKGDEYEQILKFPLTLFGKMKKINKFYEFELDINLSPILFLELKKRGILLSGHGELNHYCGKDDDGGSVWKTYYLNSPIGDENIKLSTIPNVYSLTSHEDFLWLLRNGFEFKQIQELKWR